MDNSMLKDKQGNLLSVIETDGRSHKVKYFDGRIGWLDKSDVFPVTLSEVDSPNHYELMGGEVIDLIKDRLPKDAYMGFLEGNVIKYMMRWRHKNGVEDLKKAHKYLGWMIEESHDK